MILMALVHYYSCKASMLCVDSVRLLQPIAFFFPTAFACRHAPSLGERDSYSSSLRVSLLRHTVSSLVD